MSSIGREAGPQPWDTYSKTETDNLKVAKVSSTDNAIVRFDGTSGAVQNSSVVIDDSGNVGIGTSSPSTKLQCVLSTSLGSNADGIIVSSGIKNAQMLRTGSSYNYNGITGEGSLFYSYDKLSLMADTSNPIVFSTGSSERMRIDSAGRVTMPYQPAFSVSGFSSNLTIPVNTNIKVPFVGTPTLNRGNNYSNGTFTAPVSGVYWIEAYVLLLSSSGNNATLQIRRSGSTIIYGRAKNTSETQVSVSGFVSCGAGDTIEIYVNCDLGDSLLYNGFNLFTGCLIG